MKESKSLTALAAMMILLAGQAVFAQGPAPVAKAARDGLSRVKVAAYYEIVTDGATIGRSLADMAKVLKDIRAGFIFRGFMQGPTVLDSPDNIPPELLQQPGAKPLDPKQLSDFYKENGYSYQSLKAAIAAIKKEMPDALFCGGIPAQWLNAIERDPATGAIVKPDETWKMALDPQKWNVQSEGKPFTKEDLQKFFAVRHGWARPDAPYDWRSVPAYFPDPTNEDYRKIVVGWAARQIDCGADAIWVDLMFTASAYLAQLTKNPLHPAVKATYEGAAKIVDEIRQYGHRRGGTSSWGPGPSRSSVTPTPCPPSTS